MRTQAVKAILVACAPLILAWALPAEAGSVTVSTVQAMPAAIDMTAEGTVDWAHWGLGGVAGFNRKDAGGGTPVGLIGNIAEPQGTTDISAYTTVSWTAGTPTATASTGDNVWRTFAANQGFSFTVTASASPRILRVYGGTWRNTGHAGSFVDLKATMSGGASDSRIKVNMPTEHDASTAYGYFDITFSGAGETLTVQWLRNPDTADTVNERLIGATLFSAVGPADAAHSTLSPATVTKVADGASTQVITVQARDADDNNLTSGGATVLISADAGTMDDTTDQGDGTYTATWTAPSSVGSGTATVTATLDGTAVGTAAGATEECVITLTGPADAAHSTLSPATATKAADGASTQIITVQARDASDNDLTSGGATVVFSANAGIVSGTTDHGDGTYTATWTAPSSVGSGTATVTATLDGTAVGTAVGATEECVITLTAAPSVTVSAVGGIPAGNISLTTEGTIDWAHWGFGSTVGGGAGPISINHKDVGGGIPVGLISDFTFYSTHVNPGPVGFNSLLGDIGVTLSWTDGTPTSSSAGPTGAYVFGNVADNGQGFTFTVPAAAETRTLRVYGGVYSTAVATRKVDLLATLSGGATHSQTGVVMPTVDGTGNNAYGYFDIDFSGAGETLTVDWLSTGGTGARNVKLIGATLFSAIPELPNPGTVFLLR